MYTLEEKNNILGCLRIETESITKALTIASGVASFPELAARQSAITRHLNEALAGVRALAKDVHAQAYGSES